MVKLEDLTLEINNELDYMNEQQDFTRNDFIWCYETIKRLLYELSKDYN